MEYLLFIPAATAFAACFLLLVNAPGALRWMVRLLQARRQLELELEARHPELLALMRRRGFLLAIGLHAEFVELFHDPDAEVDWQVRRALEFYMEAWVYFKERLLWGGGAIVALTLSIVAMILSWLGA